MVLFFLINKWVMIIVIIRVIIVGIKLVIMIWFNLSLKFLVVVIVLVLGEMMFLVLFLLDKVIKRVSLEICICCFIFRVIGVMIKMVIGMKIFMVVMIIVVRVSDKIVI